MEEQIFFSCEGEREFIHHYGVSKGYTLAYQKIDRCLFLSSNAKQLYRNICGYAYGDRRNCYPSQTLLRTELRWSKGTLNTYLKELVNCGLITIKNGGANRPLTYVLQELHKVNILYHSEIVLSIIPKGYEDLTKFYAKLCEYEESELFKKVQESTSPVDFVEEIKQWFSEEPVGVMEEDGVVEEAEAETTSQTVTNKRLGLVKPAPVAEFRESDTTRKRRERKDKVPLDMWNANNFLEFFKEEYFKATGLAYYGNIVEDRVFISNVVKSRNNNGHVKLLMELYIAHREVFTSISPKSFSSAFVQQTLDSIFTTGKVPAYLTKEKVREEIAKEYEDFSDLKG